MTDQAYQVAVQAADGDQAIVRSVARNLRRLRHVFEAHLVSDAAVSGADQKQRRLFVIDRDQRAPSAEIAIPASGRGVLIFPRSFRPGRSITDTVPSSSFSVYCQRMVARNSLNVLEELTYERHCEP